MRKVTKQHMQVTQMLTQHLCYLNDRMCIIMHLIHAFLWMRQLNRSTPCNTRASLLALMLAFCLIQEKLICEDCAKQSGIRNGIEAGV